MKTRQEELKSLCLETVFSHEGGGGGTGSSGLSLKYSLIDWTAEQVRSKNSL